MVNMELLWWARWSAAPPVAPVSRPQTRIVGVTASFDVPGPVLLATLRGAPLAPAAESLAVDLAADVEARLLVVDVVDAPPGRCRGVDLGAAAAATEALRRPAEEALARGLPATTLVVRATRPVDALIEVVADAAPSIVVFGPDPARLSRLRRLSPRAQRRAVRALEARTTCLLWRPDAATPPPPRRVIGMPVAR